jgi:putative protease
MVVKKKAAKKVTKKKVAKKSAKKVAKEIVKKVVKKIVKKEKKLGKITHYFDKVKVIVVKLTDDLSIGDTIRIVGGENTDFKQKIASMEIDGERIKKAKKGKVVGIKVKERVREGYKIFKI